MALKQIKHWIKISYMKPFCKGRNNFKVIWSPLTKQAMVAMSQVMAVPISMEADGQPPMNQLAQDPVMVPLPVATVEQVEQRHAGVLDVDDADEATPARFAERIDLLPIPKGPRSLNLDDVSVLFPVIYVLHFFKIQFHWFLYFFIWNCLNQWRDNELDEKTAKASNMSKFCIKFTHGQEHMLAPLLRQKT